MDSPTTQMDSLRGSFPPPALRATPSLASRGERVFHAVLALWRERLAQGWEPPENAGFPWAQVKRSLAALVTPFPSPPNPLSHSKPATQVGEGEHLHYGSLPSPTHEVGLIMGEGRRGTSWGEGHTPVLALICAGNTPLLAWPAMLFAVKHGVPIFVKMSRDETLWPQLLKESVAEVDPEAGARIICEVWPGEDPRTEELIQQADAIIAYGSDATIERLEALAGEKPFLGFGHALSIGIMTQEGMIEPFATDILTFDQQGCLSPQTIFVEGNSHTAIGVSRRLAEALEQEVSVLETPQRTDRGQAWKIREAVELAGMLPRKTLLDNGLRWAVIQHFAGDSELPLPIGFGVVHVIPVAESASLGTFLGFAKNRLSSVGVAGELTPELQAAIEAEGVSRICKAGEMQTPPLDWKNGGVDLEAWIANLER